MKVELIKACGYRLLLDIDADKKKDDIVIINRVWGKPNTTPIIRRMIGVDKLGWIVLKDISDIKDGSFSGTALSTDCDKIIAYRPLHVDSPVIDGVPRLPAINYDYGRCVGCGEETNEAYNTVPDLVCWNCGVRLIPQILKEEDISWAYANYCRDNPQEHVVVKHFEAGYKARRWSDKDVLKMLAMKTYSSWFDTETRETTYKRDFTNEEILAKYATPVPVGFKPEYDCSCGAADNLSCQQGTHLDYRVKIISTDAGDEMQGTYIYEQDRTQIG
jgi:hypothetical protein